MTIKKALFLLLLFCGNSYATKSDIESAGDITMLSLPALTLYKIWQEPEQKKLLPFIKSNAANLAMTYALKYSTQKPRPDKSDNLSFPSGHTSTSFNSAAFIHFNYGFQQALPYYIAATFVGYSRVVANKHYTEDVIAGALVGYYSAKWFAQPIKLSYDARQQGLLLGWSTILP